MPREHLNLPKTIFLVRPDSTMVVYMGVDNDAPSAELFQDVRYEC